MTSLFSTAVGALLGAAAGLLVALQVSRVQRRGDFRRKQLGEFYSPMAGWVKHVTALNTLNQRIWSEYETAWQGVVAKYGDHIPEKINDDAERFQKRIRYANEQHRNEILPLYRRMLEHFTGNYWLAESSTRTYYQDFLEFVEIWNMQEQEVLASELRERVRPNMLQVTAFFQHLETTLGTLQQHVLSGGA